MVINYRHATPCSFVEGVALSNVENFSFSSLTWYVICILIFLQSGGHHIAEHFAVRGKEPKDEVQIYTWKDATLRELTDLVLRPTLEYRGIRRVLFYFYETSFYLATSIFNKIKKS